MAEERDSLPPLTDITILEIYKMRGGVIRSATTAVTIAKALLAGLYGQSFVDKEEPFSAREEKDRWIVTGGADPAYAPRVTLSKSDARVIELDVRQPFPPRE